MTCPRCGRFDQVRAAPGTLCAPCRASDYATSIRALIPAGDGLAAVVVEMLEMSDLAGGQYIVDRCTAALQAWHAAKLE